MVYIFVLNLGNHYYCGFVIQSDNKIHLTFALNQQTQNSAEWFNSNNDLLPAYLYWIQWTMYVYEYN